MDNILPTPDSVEDNAPSGDKGSGNPNSVQEFFGNKAGEKRKQIEKEDDSYNSNRKRKQRGMNKNRGPTYRVDREAELCPRLLDRQSENDPKCEMEGCKFTHDIQQYLDTSKLPSLGDECYVFNTRGHCPRGVACRFIEWNNELILELISLYEKQRCIWDPTEPDHKNRNKVYDAWLTIEAELSVPIPLAEIRKKVDSLRSAYRALRRKVDESHSTGKGPKDIYTPSWFAYEALDRLFRANGSKLKPISSMEEYEQTPENSCSIIVDEGLDDGQETPDTIETDNSTSPVGVHLASKQSYSRKRRQPTNEMENEVRKHLRQASDALRSINKRTVNNLEDDEFSLYGKLLAEKLRGLSRRSCLSVQNAIDNLIFKAQLEEIDCENNIASSHGVQLCTLTADSVPLN